MITERVAAARAELAVRSKEAIDAETAAVWGARAVAAYEYFNHSGTAKWLVMAAEYAHEAKEHAAGGPTGTLEHVCAELQALTRGVL
jgi:hypothetical protein